MSKMIILLWTKRGIYSIENYLMTRRMMYWQVYFHKTAVAAEAMLTGALRRARQMIHAGTDLFASPALDFFLRNDITAQQFADNPECLENYMELDDTDIISALKVWMKNGDKILSVLSNNFINRRVFKTDIYDGDVPAGCVDGIRKQIAAKLALSNEETDFFVCQKVIEKRHVQHAGGPNKNSSAQRRCKYHAGGFGNNKNRYRRNTLPQNIYCTRETLKKQLY